MNIPRVLMGSWTHRFRLSWFIIASAALHGALALVRFPSADSMEQVIAPVQLYLEPVEGASAFPAPKQRPRQQLKRAGSRDRRLTSRAVSPSSVPPPTEESSRAPASIENFRQPDAVAPPAAGNATATAVTPNAELSVAAVRGVETIATGVSAAERHRGAEISTRAAYDYHPIPDYPERAKREGWEGTVLLEVFIDPLGRPERVAVNRSSGFAVLDNAAREAVKGWRFRPASVGNRQIPSTERVPIIFKLEGKN